MSKVGLGNVLVFSDLYLLFWVFNHHFESDFATLASCFCQFAPLLWNHFLQQSITAQACNFATALKHMHSPDISVWALPKDDVAESPHSNLWSTFDDDSNFAFSFSTNPFYNGKIAVCLRLRTETYVIESGSVVLQKVIEVQFYFGALCCEY